MLQIPALPHRQRGVALIMVQLAMALVVMLASGMTQQQSLRVLKAGHYRAQQQGQSSQSRDRGRTKQTKRMVQVREK